MLCISRQLQLGSAVKMQLSSKAFLILPTAFLVVLIYTVYFPFVLRKFAQRNHPHVDPYNEVGETRTEIDQEFNRLMDCDKSPYNFLYNVITFKILLIPGIQATVGVIQSVHSGYKGAIWSKNQRSR